MAAIKYTVPVIYTFQDNKTFASKRVYKIKECEDIEGKALWCDIKCPNDDDYCNPYLLGEKIFEQLKFDNAASYNHIELWVVDGATNLPVFIPGILTYEIGFDPKGTTFLNIIVDTSLLPDTLKCWNYSIGLFSCTPDPAIFDACVLTKQALGQTLEEATYNCWVELCGPGFSQIESEPYCEIPCGTSILLEGTYPKYDCNGNYYPAFITTPFTSTINSYKSQIRVYGEIYKSAITVEETLTDNERTSAKKIDAFKLLTHKVPPYVADKIGIIFAAEKVYVDGVAYKRTNSLAKNFEEGKMWIINTDLLIDCDENKFTCK